MYDHVSMYGYNTCKYIYIYYTYMLSFMQTVSEFVAIVPVFVLAFWTCFAGETFELMAQEV